MASSGMLRRVALARSDVSEELSASFIRVTRIGELGTTLAVTVQIFHRETCINTLHKTSSVAFSPSANFTDQGLPLACQVRAKFCWQKGVAWSA
jgi:hypothetical protein